MATASNRTQAAAHVEHLRFGIDFGTGTLVVAAQWISSNQRIDDVPIDYLQLRPRQDPEIEQTAVWVGDDEAEVAVKYGRMDVAQWRQENPNDDDKIIELAKLGLHEAFLHSPAVKRVFSVIGARHGDLGSLQEFITYHLRCVRRDSIEAYQKIFRDEQATRSPDFESIPQQWYITVPSLATENANGVMLNAARNAGMERVNLVEEPLCAAASALFQLHAKGRIQVCCFISEIYSPVLTRCFRKAIASRFWTLDGGLP